MKKRVGLAVSIIIGTLIFIFVLKKIGPEDILSILKNTSLTYLLVFFIFSSSEFLASAWRWKIIINVYNKKVGFLMLLKQTLACFSISYLTPSVRIGGEPLKAFMLNKESKTNMRTAATTIIIDKFIEFGGSILIGIVGLCLIFFIPEFPLPIKLILSFLILLSIVILIGFYYGIVTKRGSFTYLFSLFRLYKIKRLRKFSKSLDHVEDKIRGFLTEHKKEFILASLVYVVYGILLIIATKFLLLSFGFNASLKMIILVLTVLGIANFIPVPAAIGVLEAGQSSLFTLARKNAGLGFTFSLVERVRSIIFVCIGLGIISNFSWKQILREKGVNAS